MAIGTVFISNRTQVVRLPRDVRLPEGVHKVEVREGQRTHHCARWPTWDSFFLGGSAVSDDILTERAGQHQSERESR